MRSSKSARVHTGFLSKIQDINSYAKRCKVKVRKFSQYEQWPVYATRRNEETCVSSLISLDIIILKFPFMHSKHISCDHWRRSVLPHNKKPNSECIVWGNADHSFSEYK